MLISKAEFARNQGFSLPYVSYLINKGHVIPVEGKVDTEQALAAMAAIRKPGRALFRKGTPSSEAPQDKGQRKAASPTELSTALLKTRIKNEVERGKMLEIEAKVKTGQYVDAEIVEKQAFQVGRTVRDSLQNIPDRVASLLASLSDAHQIYDILTKEIRLALEGLAEALENP
ncbi:hypothetical protein AGMMS49949_01440 [Alphaproteobacteria bacterium]|nr:hypothetical protein AGMMS49949_01440 [Alphaproteobacteria bacterium]GHS97059.1 hypothetical protein AGMMS50296_3710 [Alphaproteobacteria bacterium]